MAWTATITNIQDDGTSVKVSFSFTDGIVTNLVTDRGFSTDAEIKRFILNQILAYENKGSISVHVNDSFDKVTLTPVTQPLTPEQIYQVQRNKLVVAKQDLDMGVINQTAYDIIKQATILLKP